jgi:hypothetical protein
MLGIQQKLITHI